jgi:hypothetical protein
MWHAPRDSLSAVSASASVEVAATAAHAASTASTEVTEAAPAEIAATASIEAAEATAAETSYAAGSWRGHLRYGSVLLRSLRSHLWLTIEPLTTLGRLVDLRGRRVACRSIE